jgi:outer membrane receptor protein involved in Fe transport
MRYLGKQLTSTYENFYALPSACTTATPPICPPLNSDAFEIREYPAVFYHDIRMDFAIGENKQSNFFIGVDNVLDTNPPLGTTATGAGSAIFNIRGRSFYSGFKARF